MEMVERVAEAIRESIKAQMDGHPIPGDVAPDSWTASGGTVDCVLIARAAIEAMREPTEAMLRQAVADADEYRFGQHEARHAWLAMIDSALTSHTDTPKET